MDSEQIKSKILQRRLQMLVHSYLYYYLSQPVISDEQFDEWAYELVELQAQYPSLSKSVEHYDTFYDWDGTTGFDLRIGGDTAVRARRVLRYYEGHIKGG